MRIKFSTLLWHRLESGVTARQLTAPGQASVNKQENDSPQTTRSGNFLEDNLYPDSGSLSRMLKQGNFDTHATPGVAGQSMPSIFEGLGAKAGVGGADELRMTPSHLGWQGLLQDTSGLNAGSLSSPHFRVQLPLLGSEVWLLTLASASLCCSISPSKGLPEILGQPFLTFYWLKSPRAQVTKTVLLKGRHTGWVQVDLCVYSSLRHWMCSDYFAQSVQFSSVGSVVSESLRPHGLQHTRSPCPSPTLRACSNSCPWSQWCHPTISSSVIPFSSCLQSFPATRSSPMNPFFAQYLRQFILLWNSETLLTFFPLPLKSLFQRCPNYMTVALFPVCVKIFTKPKKNGGGLVAQSCPVLVNPWTVAWQAPLSLGFSKPEYWSGLPFPSPGDLPNPEV